MLQRGNHVSFAPARPTPIRIDLARTGLVVVDMQNDFLHPEGWFATSGQNVAPLARLVPRVAAAADWLRGLGATIVWINWGIRPGKDTLPINILDKASLGGCRPVYGDPAPSGRGRILVAGDWGAALMTGLRALPGDLVIDKKRFSGFFETGLEAELRARDLDMLLFAGVNTDRCVFATLTDASYRGFHCVLLEDLCATVSPDSVSEAVIYLVRLLYGASTSSQAVLDAITSDFRSPSS